MIMGFVTLNLFARYGFRTNLACCIIGISKRIECSLVTFTLFSHDLDSKIELCLHSVWKTNTWIFTKLAWIHHQERDKKGDLYCIFKAIYVLRMSYFDHKHVVCCLSLESVD